MIKHVKIPSNITKEDTNNRETKAKKFSIYFKPKTSSSLSPSISHHNSQNQKTKAQNTNISNPCVFSKITLGRNQNSKSTPFFSPVGPDNYKKEEITNNQILNSSSIVNNIHLFNDNKIINADKMDSFNKDNNKTLIDIIQKLKIENTKLKEELKILKANYLKEHYDYIIKEKDFIINQLQNRLKFNDTRVLNLEKRVQDYELVLTNLKNSINNYSEENSMKLEKEIKSKNKTIAKLNLRIKNQKFIIDKLKNKNLSSQNIYSEREESLNNIKNYSLKEKEFLFKKKLFNINNSKNKNISHIKSNSNSLEIHTDKDKAMRYFSENKKIKKNISKKEKDNNVINNKRIRLQKTKNIIFKNKYNDCDIKEINAKDTAYIYRVYDKTKIISFNIKSKEYQIIEYYDKDSFKENFILEGSLYLNIENGLFILTGKENNLLYYFNNNNCSITKVYSFLYNHSQGALIYDQLNKGIIASSGKFNKKVEEYLITNQNNQINNYINSSNMNDKIISLPDMLIERSESCYLYLNNKIYAFFGYCYPTRSYITSIEFLDLSNSNLTWNTLEYNNSKGLYLLKGSCSIPVNNNEILLIGGFNGRSQNYNDNILVYNFEKHTLENTFKKIPSILNNHSFNFIRESQFLSFYNGSLLANFDEMRNVHMIELPKFKYDIFKFN